MLNDRLGKGLSALIREPEADSRNEAGITVLPVSAISPNRYQPRKTFDPAKLAELAASIKENGIIQPLIVSRTERSGYELIAGERRLEAAKLAGLSNVPVVVRCVSDKELLQLAIIENIQREDLNPIEEALAYKSLIDEFAMTHAQIAQIMGKERTTITNSIRLLKLPIPVQNMINQGLISPGHARAILSLEDHKQLAFAEFILKYRLNVRQAEEKARDFNPNPVHPASKAPELKALELELKKCLGAKVSIKEKKGKGQISIPYQNEQELARLIDTLRSIK